jgi:glucose-1-phosphate adenylyltransferase
MEAYPVIYTKADDLPPAKLNAGSHVKNSLIASGSIINGTVEDSLIFKKSFIGSNCYIKNSIVLNDVYIADNSHLENCIVESNETLLSDTNYIGENEIKVISERNNRFGV